MTASGPVVPTDGRWEEVPPDPAALIESMRAFGYSLPAAIADLVDNSISARATTIDVRLHWAGEDSWIAVVDDGDGMNADAVTSAMRLGSRNPDEARDPGDLGRFGLGLKTASFSQARCLTVATRARGGETETRHWDLDHVTATRRWSLLFAADRTAVPGVALLDGASHGTAVVLTRLDRLSGGSTLDDQDAHTHFLRHSESVRRHLAMTFHRFLHSHRLQISVNQHAVIAWDPFMTDTGQAQVGPTEQLRTDTGTVTVIPHVLPHFSRISTEQHSAAAGPRGWNQHQGFYVYRAGRLLVDGGWLDLPLVAEEHYKLARIRVDLDNSMDHEWQIDVRKATARIPRFLSADMRRVANATRQKAARAYRHRGKRLAGIGGGGTPVGVWDARIRRGMLSYRVDRTHPLVDAALRAAGVARPDVERALRVVEETLPVASIVMDARERPDTTAGSFEGSEAELAAILRAGFDALVANAVPAADALRVLGGREPFNEHPALLAALAEQEGIA